MWIAIGAGVLAALAFVFVMFAVVPKIALDRIQARLATRVAEAVPADEIVRQDLAANSLGLESRGVTQARGNGALVLTATELRWLQLTPTSSDVTIPLAGITGVGTVRSHLGKSYGRPLLHVSFTDDGAVDSMAWYSADVPGWIEALGGPLGPDAGPAPAT